MLERSNEAGLRVLETDRLILRRLTYFDAAFILELVNDPEWIRHIRDCNVHALEEAEAYLENGPIASYTRHGFGLFRAELKGTGAPIGIAGLLRRETRAEVDVGYAMLHAFRGHGYAGEAVAGLER